MTIKIVFVDIGGVLILNEADRIGNYYENEKGLSKLMAKDIFRFIQSKIRNKEEVDSYLFGKSVSRRIWDEYVDQFIHSEVRNDELYEILNNAKNRQIMVFYTSNNSSGLEKVLDKYDLLKLPDVIVNSSKAQVIKPDKAFWEVSFRESKKKIKTIKKCEILVIDDSVTNYKSALDFGFKAILYNKDSTKQIVEMLR